MGAAAAGGALPATPERARAGVWDRPWIGALIALGLFVVALAVRFYQLDQYPPGLYNDEAAYANDALGVLQGRYALFFERNNGREPLFIYLLALVFRLFGATPYTIRATAALVGALTVPAAYWLAAASARFEFPQRPAAARLLGLWVGLFLAFSYWHISFSRLGFRAITLPLVMSLAFVFVWRAWRRLRDESGLPWGDLVAAGLLLGLCFYTYTSGRMALPVFAVLALITLLRPAEGLTRRRVLAATGAILLVALIVIGPLAAYFGSHPASFGARAVSVSIFSKEFAPEGPAAALANGIVKTALMFGVEPDGNLRHNPAQQPVVDWLLGLWLLAGCALAIVQWRRTPLLVYLAWALLMAAPALLSAEGMPHSLRTIGMIPAVFILPVSAMLWAGERLLRGRAPWAGLLPLPFLAVSAVVSLSGYFGAWQPADRFRAPFLTDYVALGRTLAQQSPESVWLLALSPNYYLSDTRMNTIEFFVRDQVPYATLLMDAATLPDELARVVDGRTQVTVVRPYDAPQLSETSFVFLDAKGLLDFVLRRNGRVTGTDDGAALDGFPSTTYTLRPGADFGVPEPQAREPVPLGGRLALTGAALGGAGDASAAEGAGAVSLRSDQPLWAVLRWDALAPIDQDLKTSLLLVDAAGHVAGQVDGLLTGDGYPVERVWPQGETTQTYHILEPLPAIPPGEYELRLKVYEDATGRVYTVTQPDGAAAATVPLARVTVAPPESLPAVTPQFATSAPAAGDVALLGFDLARPTIAPGDRLPVTLYWQAGAQPRIGLSRRVTLVGEDGTVVAADEGAPGGEIYPAEAWRAGEIVRDWVDLRVAPDAPAQSYALRVAFGDGVVENDEMIALVEVQGRPRVFDLPPVSVPAEATFGDAVRLVGVEPPDALVAGQELALRLVWQPLRDVPEGIVRFAHLIDGSGQLVAQQDTIPCGGECPSTSWLEGEYLVDEARLALPVDLPPGPYTLLAGWYDPATQQRLPARDGSGAPLANDAATIPLE